MQLIFKKSSILKKIVDAIKDVCKETNIELSENGLHIKAMDCSHVCLVNLKISSLIENIISEKPVIIAINLEQLSKVLRLFDNEAELFLFHADNKLTLTSTYEGQKAKFDISLMDIEMDSLDLPDLCYTTSIKLPTSEYNKLCSSFKDFGDSVTFQCREDKVKIYVNGDLSSGHIELENGSKNEIISQTDKDISFSLKYLCLFCKACSCTDFCTINLGENIPMKLKFPLGEDDVLEFYIAPKLD
tara:strand:+ start:318 stop:1049 length:732 start_codon:yes stop_codon:yes gene_type:complete